MDNPMQPLIQPFARLAESNIAAVTQFWMSPEVMWLPMAAWQRMTPQGTSAPVAPPAQPEAVSRLMKGLLENYTRFLSELMQAGSSVWGRAPAATLWAVPPRPAPQQNAA